MKLSEFIKCKEISVADMARDLNKQHCVVRRWVIGTKIPTAENMQKIIAYTGGEVTPNDFFNIDENKGA